MARTYSTVNVEEAEGIHTITLNRPECRNALNPQMSAELSHALDQAALCSCEVVILTGAGSAFCSGMDLNFLEAAGKQNPEDQRADAESMMWLMRRLYELTKPTIAAVNGAAIAGGAGLATLCDFTLAAAGAKFGYTEVRIGFIPAMVAVFLVRMLGDKRARELLLSGRTFTAEEARDLGLVTEVVAPDDLLPRAREMAGMLMKNSPESMGAVKKFLGGFDREKLNRDLGRALGWSERIRNSKDFAEGLRAFQEKREPVWPGRGRQSR